MRRTVQIAVVAIVAATLGWSVLIEPNRLVVRRERLITSSLPSLRIAVLSDIHTGAPFVDRRKLSTIVDRVHAERPDLILLAGDYVIGHGIGEGQVIGGRLVGPEETAAELGRLRAPLGVFAVLGNHDWWFDGGRIRRALSSVGIRVLEDQVAEVKSPGGSVWLWGIGDATTRIADLRGPLYAVPVGAPVIAFTHNPDRFPDIPSTVALTVAGHTHGGQVRLPLIGSPIVPSQFGRRYAAGHVEERGHHLFVTTGIGTSILPVRLFVPPEIAILSVGP